MENFLKFASERRSIRKYEDREIPAEDIEYFIKAAVTAPSGCNSQCWRFVAVTDKELINKMAEAVIRHMEELLAKGKDTLEEQYTEKYLASKRKMVSFFRNAPVVVAVFMTHLEYYDPAVTAALREKGMNYEDMMKLMAYPDVLSVGAAVQNLLLAVHEKGYGACWMNEPAVAAAEIGEILGEPATHKFMSMIPIGYPAYAPREKALKEFSEVYELK